MALYHVGPSGPDICRVTVGHCPYGNSKLANNGHFDNIADAQIFFEADMTAKYGSFGTKIADETKRSINYRMLDRMDKLEASNPFVKKIRDYNAYRSHAPTKRNLKADARNSNGRKSSYRGGRRRRGNGFSRFVFRSGKALCKAIGPTPRNITRFFKAVDRAVQQTLR